jgi:RND family efflux transporter MFP subunit
MSLAELDRQQHAVSAANAQVAALRAAAAEADNKLAYAQLRADADGVVTQVLAEAGQVVGEGTPVLIVARSAAREVEFSVPEQRRASLKTGQPVQVSLWSEPDTWMEGRVRWIAPTADAVTRAFPVRAFLIAPPGTLDLGVTATVRVTPPDDAQSQISLPIASVFDNHGASSVWIFDQKAGTLRQVPVKITGVSGNRYLIGGGVQPGDLVVTAGVHRLSVHDRVALFTGGERATDLANR